MHTQHTMALTKYLYSIPVTVIVVVVDDDVVFLQLVLSSHLKHFVLIEIVNETMERLY